MFERFDREADGEVYVSEVLDFLRRMSDDPDWTREIIIIMRAVQVLLSVLRQRGVKILYLADLMVRHWSLRQARSQ